MDRRPITFRLPSLEPCRGRCRVSNRRRIALRYWSAGPVGRLTSPKKAFQGVTGYRLDWFVRMSMFFFWISIIIRVLFLNVIFFNYFQTLHIASNHKTKIRWFQLQSLKICADGRTICTAPGRVPMWAAPISPTRKCDVPEVYLISCPGWEVLLERYEFQVPNFFP